MESRNALIFGGQGSQFLLMGKKAYNYSLKAKNIFEIASSVVGYDVKELCFNGPLEKLNRTLYCQICTLTVELAIYEIFKKLDINIDAMAGFSLGEYAAMYASKIIDLESVFRLVKIRASVMESMLPENKAKMIAIINLDIEKIDDLCSDFGYNNAAIANYNSYNQVVVSVKNDCYDYLLNSVKALGGYTITLNVGRPFHHQMMRPAADLYLTELKKYTFKTPICSFYLNTTGEKYNENTSITWQLYKQIYKPVQWVRIIENMLSEGVNKFYEISPKATLAPFIDNISFGNVRTIDVQQLF